MSTFLQWIYGRLPILSGDFGLEAKEDHKFRPHTHQVAGHRVENGRAEFAMLYGRPGRVLKPYQDHDRGQTELDFYTKVGQDQTLAKLRPFLPHFHGLLRQNNLLYLELADLTFEFNEPCIVDIKIGAILYGPEKIAADAERIERKYPLARQIGYQILGMKTFCPASNKYLFHDKIYFRESLTMENVVDEGLGLFFQCYRPVRRQLITDIVAKLEGISAWFSEQKSFVFYGSSLLIMYEGGAYGTCSLHGENGKKRSDVIVPPKVDVRMIDFTHVLPSESLDENYLYGLSTLSTHLGSLLE